MSPHLLPLVEHNGDRLGIVVRASPFYRGGHEARRHAAFDDRNCFGFVASLINSFCFISRPFRTCITAATEYEYEELLGEPHLNFFSENRIHENPLEPVPR